MDKTNDVLKIVGMSEALNRLDVLQSFLRASFQITEVKGQVFGPRWSTPDEVIVTHRFIMIRSGALNYTVEGVKHRMTEGTQLFVPAWSRREWTLPRGVGECSLLWCAFSSSSAGLPPAIYWRRPQRWRAEILAFEAMRKTMGEASKTMGESPGERSAMLVLEAEMKVCLARFWVEAQVVNGTSLRAQPLHPEVARAKAWLERSFAEPDALDAFYRTIGMSPNHFRLLFRRQTGDTVQGMLARLRLRRARYLVQETSMPMKQIAAETGYGDALYFSNQYRKFWGWPATTDRVSGGVA